jgi:1,4-alpha-glucan branching enzyme
MPKLIVAESFVSRHTSVNCTIASRALRPDGRQVPAVRLESLTYVFCLTLRSFDEQQRAWTSRLRSILTDHDLYLFNEGTHYRLFEKLGSHLLTVDGTAGTHFAVWAPNANYVAVLGDFNGWDTAAHPLRATGDSGVWQGFIPGVLEGANYKYYISSHNSGYTVEKADPYALRAELPPRTASVVATLDYTWNDQEWMSKRRQRNSLSAPFSVYEVHLGSWRRMPEQDSRPLSYREIAAPLADYVKRMGFTHIELMPVMEHPFTGSWGYQVTGYFAATSRYGSPQDLMYLIEHLHQNDIGVILDWVPAHFPSDRHGLGYFDGTHLYEHADPQKGYHPDWDSLIFNYGRNEVRGFLFSSALFWFDHYHVDGLRVDAVASMLYLDYSRKEGGWIPNEFGGRENLEAISLLRRLNEVVYGNHPDVQMIAEESTAWPMVSRPVYVGGLGFGLKWDMGWMHDTLKYMSKECVHRKFHHNGLTFRMLYAFTENFLLPLSHDEVVHGKGSILDRMPGDIWQKFANLRLLYGYMFGQAGKKMLFMGGEFGQWREWHHDESLDWHLCDFPSHQGVQRWVADLNRFYRTEPAMHVGDLEPFGFEWIAANDSDQSMLSFLRKGHGKRDWVLVVCNFTPVPRYGYRLGVPEAGFWKEVLNSDAKDYWGGGMGNTGGVVSQPTGSHGKGHSVEILAPPLGVVFFRLEG